MTVLCGWLKVFMQLNLTNKNKHVISTNQVQDNHELGFLIFPVNSLKVDTTVSQTPPTGGHGWLAGPG